MLKSFLGAKTRTQGARPPARTYSNAEIADLGGSVNLKDKNG